MAWRVRAESTAVPCRWGGRSMGACRGALPHRGHSGTSISASPPPVTCSTATSCVPTSAACSSAYLVRAGWVMRVAAPPTTPLEEMGASEEMPGHSSPAHRRSWACLMPPSGILKRGEFRKLGSRTDREMPGVSIILI